MINRELWPGCPECKRHFPTSAAVKLHMNSAHDRTINQVRAVFDRIRNEGLALWDDTEAVARAAVKLGLRKR